MAWQAVAAAGVQAGAGIGGTLLANRQSRKNQERQNNWNAQQANLAYQRDLEMWNKQNEYNSPLAQMQRLKEAGLNPNLMYGQGNVGNAGAPPSYHAPQGRFDEKPISLEAIPQALQMYQDFRVRQAQINNLEAAEANTRARTLTESFRSFLTEFQGKNSEFDYNMKDTLRSYQVQIKDAEARKSVIDVDKAFKELLLMNQQEQMNALNQRYKSKQLSMQDIEAEQRQADLLFSQMRNDWMKMGVTTSDNALVRILVRMMNEAGIHDFNDIKNMVMKLF